ncbi:S1 family peptidase [Fuchsiella alkaliacetigena]|uniref:S1 family peptidase n=1 Tax=Fuchsiella alkaliacetigena TaxID=957042 RepID=UPI00200A4766|nr:S1 family peptidase [Fuchsiella alkaliacetigena]MCK8824991.1 S1 family peptidase [Fuchsiella alkaliacetigena]
MEDLSQLVKKYWKKLLSKENVVGVGCGQKRKNGKDTNEKALTILVEKKVCKDELGEKNIVPEQIEETETDVIEVGEIELLGLQKASANHRTSRMNRTSRRRPAYPGSSLAHYKVSAGTFGALVRDKDTGEPLILSNNHVLANLTSGYDGRAKIGDPILQPGRQDGGSQEEDIIAYLEDFAPIKKPEVDNASLLVEGLENIANGVSDLIKFPYWIKFVSKAQGENLIDGAVAKPVSKQQVKNRILEVGNVRGTNKAEVGMKVKKSGRTTGLTKSRIIAVNATVSVNITATEKAIFSEQIISEPFSKPGDSGSLVLDANNRALGLLFAGSEKSTICNKIDNVIEALNIEFY